MKRVFGWLALGLVSVACVPIGMVAAADHWLGFVLMAAPVLLLLICGAKFLRIIHSSICAATAFWAGVALMVSWVVAVCGLALVLFIFALRRMSDAITVTPPPVDNNRSNGINISTGRPNGGPDAFDITKDYGI